MKRTVLLIVVIMTMLARFCVPACAWLRSWYEDAQIVQRSELIVVGHLKVDSIVYVPHVKPPGGGASWEHRATLVVSEVLKGRLEEKELVITIHYGLDPLVGGVIEREGTIRYNLRFNRKDYPKDIIEILDTGNSAMSLQPLVKDAGEDNIWFLCHRAGTYGREFRDDSYGIADPEDLQPLALKTYFMAYLSKDPEQAVKQQMKKHLDIAKRAQRYLDHMEIQRVLKIDDPKTRVEKLLPYFIEGFQWGMKREAADGIKDCGEAAVPRLLKLLEEETERRFLRRRTIGLLGEIGSKSAVPALVALLEKYDKHWEKEMAKPDWDAKQISESQPNYQVYSETCAIVYALLQTGDPRSRGALEQTGKRWKKINYRDKQIVENCDRSLELLSEKEGKQGGVKQ